jgi:hypothetical protein
MDWLWYSIPFLICSIGLWVFVGELYMAIDPDEFDCMSKPERPLRNHRSGKVTLERGYEICRMAAWHREQMEGELAELCEMFGVQIHEDCNTRDWCMEVIYDGSLTLDDCIDRVAAEQREKRGAKS